MGTFISHLGNVSYVDLTDITSIKAQKYLVNLI